MPDNYLAPTGDTFPDVYQIEKQDAWVGGPGGLANKQGLSLAERTQFLNLQRQAHSADQDPHPQYMTQDETTALIEARVGDFSLDTGTANAKVVALNPAIVAYADNFGGSFKNLLLNTDAVTVDFGGGAVPLVREDGAALIAGDLPAGAVVGYQYIHADAKAYVTNMVAAHAITAAEDPTGADNSTRVSTTGWMRNAMAAIAVAAGFAWSFSTNGYIKFPTWLAGWVVQWGQIVITSADVSLTGSFPINFPNTCHAMACCTRSPGALTQITGCQPTGTDSFYYWGANTSGSTVSICNFMAIGN